MKPWNKEEAENKRTECSTLGKAAIMGEGGLSKIAAGKVGKESELSLKKLRKERISKLRGLIICPIPIEKS